VALTDSDKSWIVQTVQAHAVDTAELARVLSTALAGAADDHLAVSGWSEGFPGRTEKQHHE
jgi:hypothetical protein